MAEEASSNDLPMSANLHDIAVKHFTLDLACHVSQQIFEGSVTLWCVPTHTPEAGENCENVSRQEACESVLTGNVERHENVSRQRISNNNPVISPDVSNNTNSSSIPPQSCSLSIQPEPFKMILDCFKVQVHRVEGIYLLENDKQNFEKDPNNFVKTRINVKDTVSHFQQRRCPMQFTVKEHCIHVFINGVNSSGQFPHAVQIWYKTHPSGPSLKWTKDQDDHQCVFTGGHFLSNRSLFPSQDVPSALFTWQASVTVEDGWTVILTGDQDPEITLTDHGKKTFSFFTDFPMPSSTFALAVGCWEMMPLCYDSLENNDCPAISRPPIRLFFPGQLREKCVSLLGSYLPACMLEVQRMLGTYPFCRLDVLLVPACFDSLGMASPSLLFLSQSVLCADGSMSVRVAHELCHTWFGIVIGPRDWTEEWMTEGFCTYLEDILHAQVTQLGDKTEDYLRLRAELHLRLLKTEIENTDENLQTLRPSRGVEESPVCGEETRFLKDGMNVEKKFMQIHYLKGYFLLRALDQKVGRRHFLMFLKDYVRRFMCQLVTSQDFLKMFLSTFPHLTDVSLESINKDWLDCPGMPQMLVNQEDKDTGIIDNKNALCRQVQQQLTSIIAACRPQRRKRRRGHHHQPFQPTSPALDQLMAPQVILLFDRLLEERLVPGHVLDLLRSSYDLHLDNAEVCHGWCELVIKHKCRKYYGDVKQFLVNHQAMGVYLYGEASISQCPAILTLARSCFRQLQHDMPESVCDTVAAMLYGT